MKVKKSSDNVHEELFGNVTQASKVNRPWTEIKPTWCELSETRFYTSIVNFKPLGSNKEFHLGQIVDRMHNIYEDEPPGFEDFLKPEDMILLQRRDDQTKNKQVQRFEPKYKFRPTSEQIMKKLESMYDLRELEENSPDEPLKSTEFIMSDTKYDDYLNDDSPTPTQSVHGPPSKKTKRAVSPRSSQSRSETRSRRGTSRDSRKGKREDSRDIDKKDLSRSQSREVRKTSSSIDSRDTTPSSSI